MRKEERIETARSSTFMSGIAKVVAPCPFCKLHNIVYIEKSGKIRPENKCIHLIENKTVLARMYFEAEIGAPKVKKETVKKTKIPEASIFDNKVADVLKKCSGSADDIAKNMRK